jgi:hypothetical protein
MKTANVRDLMVGCRASVWHMPLINEEALTMCLTYIFCGRDRDSVTRPAYSSLTVFIKGSKSGD